MGHVASSFPRSVPDVNNKISVTLGPCGSCHPVITLKTLWGSPGTELSTWSIGIVCCIRAIQGTRIASRPLRSYTAIQLYSAIHYTAIHRYTLYNLCNTPLNELNRSCVRVACNEG